MATMTSSANVLLDARGYRRSAATRPGYHRGRVPRNRGRRYQPDPPTTEEIIQLLRACPHSPSGRRLKALIIVLWRSGLRISEALALEERDLDVAAGSITVRCGKGGKRRIVGMDRWAWAQIAGWLEERLQFPRGPVFCVVQGPTTGRHLTPSSVRATLRVLGTRCGIRRHRAAPAAPLPRGRARPRGSPRPHLAAPARPRQSRRHDRVARIRLTQEVLAAMDRRQPPSVAVGHLLAV